MKTITSREMAAIKRAAMDVAPLSVKKAKASAKMAEMVNEIKRLDAQIEARQSYIKMTTGFTTEDLVVRTVAPYLNEDGTQKVDKDGHPLSQTKYVPNEALIYWDATKKVFVIKEVADQAPVETTEQATEQEAMEAVMEEKAAAIADAEDDLLV